MASSNSNQPNSNEIKSILTSLLTSSTNVCTVKGLCDDFLNFEGYALPFRQMGFPNAEDYFRSIPDTIIVHGSGPHAHVQGIIKPKSAHIVEMVAKQKKSKSHNRKYSRPRYSSSYKRPPECRPQNNYTPYKQSFGLRPNNNYMPQTNSPKVDSPVGVDNWLKFNRNANIQINLNAPVPLLSLNLDHMEPLIRLPKVQTKNSSPLGKESMKISESTSDCYQKEEKPKGFDESTDSIQLEQSLESEDLHPNVPKRIRDNLKKLIGEFPNGVWCSELPAEYNKMFKKKLHYERYSYRSLIEMCVDLPDIFRYTRPTPDDFLLSDQTKPVPKVDLAEIDSRLPVKEHVVTSNILNEISTLNWDTVGAHIAPADVLRLGEFIPRLVFDDTFKVNLYKDISIGEIYDISKFWMTLDNGPLDGLMRELHDFFQNNRHKYQIPDALLEEGLYCCSLYIGKYHRCVIVSLLPKLTGFVRVFFIDYGTVENVCSNEIWFLPKRFAEAPCQAIRARLAAICPPTEGLPWSRKAINRFNSLITNTVLIAEIIRVDEEDSVLEVYLSDVCDQNKIFYINDVLVKEKLAVYTDQERERARLHPDWILESKYVHLTPEFDEIEAGSAPSTSDINYIVANNMPMHHYLPHYFDVAVDIDTSDIEEFYEQSLEESEYIPEIDLKEIKNDFDFTCFPSDILDDISESTEGERTPRAEVREAAAAQSGSSGDGATENSVKEYFCNKNRLAKLKVGITEGQEELEKSLSSDISQGESSLDLDLSNMKLNNSNISKHNSTNPFLSDAYLNDIPKPKSTNPFLNDEPLSDVCTNPLSGQIPTINSIGEIDAKELFEEFSKSSSDNFPRSIVNNLNPSPTFTRKLKQVNLERDENRDSSIRSGRVTNPFSVDKVENRPQIRAPPGFTNPAPIPSVIPPYNYAANNPYYQRYPQFQWNSTVYLQNQFGMTMPQSSYAMDPNFMNMMPQFNPQFQFNLQTLQQAFAPNLSHLAPGAANNFSQDKKF